MIKTNSDQNRAILQQDLNRIHSKIEGIDAHLSDLKSITAVQNQQLAEHMRRSDLLEKRVEQVDSRIDPIEKLSIRIQAIGAAIVFVLTLPHLERLFSWLSAFFS